MTVILWLSWHVHLIRRIDDDIAFTWFSVSTNANLLTFPRVQTSIMNMKIWKRNIEDMLSFHAIQNVKFRSETKTGFNRSKCHFLMKIYQPYHVHSQQRWASVSYLVINIQKTINAKCSGRISPRSAAVYSVHDVI